MREAFDDCNLQDYQLVGGRVVDVTSPHAHSRGRYVARSDPHGSGTGARYNSIFFVQRVRRYPGFYLFNLYLPTFLICSFAFSAFAFLVDDFTDRSNIIVTVLLTVVAFKQAIKQYTPSLPYQTFVDRYILAGLSAVIILAIEMASLSAAAVCQATPSRKPTLCGPALLGSLDYKYVDIGDFVAMVSTGGVWLLYQVFEFYEICKTIKSNWIDDLHAALGEPPRKSTAADS